MLTNEQREAVDIAIKKYGILSISTIACKLGLTRQYVQDYIKSKNN